MSKEWTLKEIRSIEEFAQWLAISTLSVNEAFRGQADARWDLSPSLDRTAHGDCTYQARLSGEKKCINSFCDQSYRFLGNIERSYLRSHPDDKVLRMTVMQHFGAPTRLLDWTRSAAIAAYFACIDECRRDGAVWWVNEDAIVSSVHPHWEARGFKRSPELGGQVNLNSGIFNPNIDTVVSLTYLRIPFSRAQAQRGLFTIGSRLGPAHDAVLSEQLPVDTYGRILIPSNLKGSVIDYLDRIGIDAVSIQHTGADRTGLRIAWETMKQD